MFRVLVFPEWLNHRVASLLSKLVGNTWNKINIEEDAAWIVGLYGDVTKYLRREKRLPG